jgi:hypothetical protein
VLSGKTSLSPSENPYDWLGHGIYFWENSPQRARDWAKFLAAGRRKSARAISRPFVLGAIIDLGLCLDLTEAASLELVRESHTRMTELFEVSGRPLPVNEPAVSADADLLLRNLDCAVINYVHAVREEEALAPYDSVRGAFFEGRPLYPGAGISAKTHLQICVRNPRQIRGYFRPLQK